MQLPIFIKEAGFKLKKEGKRARLGLYKCKCGKEFIAMCTCVKTGNTKSCGCLNDERFRLMVTKHGLSHKHPLYSIWQGIKSRCLNVNSKAYTRYGARGITICERWLYSFDLFYNDMLPLYKKDMQLDRIDNNKGYFKENCHWVTASKNCRNKNNNRIINYKGKNLTLTDACEKYNLNYERTRRRLIRGWSVNDAIEKPHRCANKI